MPKFLSRNFKWKHRLAMTALAFPLAIVAGVLAATIDVALVNPLDRWWWKSNFGQYTLFFLVSAAGLLIFPPLGFVWGRRKDFAAQESADL